MTQDEIIRMAREAGCHASVITGAICFNPDVLERFAALVAAHVKSDQINTAYQQGCEDMKRRMEKRMQQLESQLQLCQTAVADEREAILEIVKTIGGEFAVDCAAAIRARSDNDN